VTRGIWEVKQRSLEGEMSASVDKHESPVLNDENPLKLGIFGINMRGGVTLSPIEGMVEGTWEENLRYAKWADRIGIDAIVPIARWRGYGGEANLGDRSFETFTWATGLLSATERAQIFATVHVPIVHPALAAKMMATADHISGGRIGLNIVAGWNPEEMSMFGMTQREHDERYQVADEWAQVIKQLWTVEEAQDFDGEYYKVPGGFSQPKPLQKPYPVIMNAGTSGAGREFAAKHSDLIFAGLTTLETAADQVAEIKALARDNYGREIKVFGRAHVVCRDTEAAAKAEYDRVHKEVADVEGAKNIVRLNMPNSQSADWESLKMEKILEGTVAGLWALPLVGTPEQVAQKMIDLHGAGLDGIAFSWPDFDEGLEQLEQSILPQLVEAGVRAPVAAPSAA
jgi:alkanesulfonate monooxygenase SsuD/methylene tetrahydromethanopterin reductase-like flavin-dependent oxidoreductase (luciferase family)